MGRRKLKGSRAPAERCTFCGGNARGTRALRLRTGQVACPRCQEHGGLQRLACGHYGVAGALKVVECGDGKTFVCAACAADSGAFGLARLGLPKR
jgi:hypothetical protein